MTCSNRPAAHGGDEYTKDLRCVGATRERESAIKRRERMKKENGNAVETRATGGGKSGQCYFVDLTVQTARALSGAVSMQMEWMARRDESSSSHLGNFLNATILAALCPTRMSKCGNTSFFSPRCARIAGKDSLPVPTFQTRRHCFR